MKYLVAGGLRIRKGSLCVISLTSLLMRTYFARYTVCGHFDGSAALQSKIAVTAKMSKLSYAPYWVPAAFLHIIRLCKDQSLHAFLSNPGIFGCSNCKTWGKQGYYKARLQ